MSDERLREAARSARSTRDPADTARHLAEQLRAGTLTRPQLRALAFRQAPGARLALGDDDDPRLALLESGREALAGRVDPALGVVELLEPAVEVVGFLLCLRPPRLLFPLRAGPTLVGRSRHHTPHEHGPRWSGRRVVLEGAQWRITCVADGAFVEDASSSNGSALVSATDALPALLDLRLGARLEGHPGRSVPRTPGGAPLVEGDVLVGCYAAFLFGRRWR